MTNEEQTTHYTIAPGIDSQIIMKVRPGAVCTLHKDDETDTRYGLKLCSDQDGIIRFYVRAIESTDLAKVVVDCEHGGRVTRYPLELRFNSKPTKEMPSPPPETPIRAGSIRPALSSEDMLRLSQKELLQRHYPPRPDPKQEPESFSAWRSAVSRPSTIVEPYIVPRTGISHSYRIVNGPNSALNWSGYELRSPQYPFLTVVGQWKIPTIAGFPSGYPLTPTYSSTWVGIDGDGTTDLAQAGSSHDLIVISKMAYSFSFYAWSEFLPDQQTEQVVTNFPISPGDIFLVSVQAENFDTYYNFENQTKGISTRIYNRTNVKVGGTEAEWIVERPTVNGGLPDLTCYTEISIGNAWAYIGNSPNWLHYQNTTLTDLLQINMINNSDTLSTVTPVDTDHMLFSWHAFI